MATVEEIEEAVQARAAGGGGQIALLKCSSAYPAPAEEMNLRTIPELARRFECPGGAFDPITRWGSRFRLRRSRWARASLKST